MVEGIKKIIQQVKKEKGDISLFMLWKDEPNYDKWTIIISANWIDKLNQKIAFNYWLSLLQSNLNSNDLDNIGRINFIKSNDEFIKTIISTLSISGGPAYFQNNQIGNYYIKDAIIFESKKMITDNTISISRRNPLLNSRLNPNLNSRINPNLNSRINPNLNSRINPNLNSRINPNLNSRINPNLNSRINPNLNSRINPNLNSRLNPNLNSRINPNLNSNFTGLFLYDLRLQKIGYFIEASENVLLLFDLNNEYINLCVKSSDQSYNIFDKFNKNIGFITSDGEKGFNYFNKSNQWIGVAK